MTASKKDAGHKICVDKHYVGRAKYNISEYKYTS